MGLFKRSKGNNTTANNTGNDAGNDAGNKVVNVPVNVHQNTTGAPTGQNVNQENVDQNQPVGDQTQNNVVPHPVEPVNNQPVNQVPPANTEDKKDRKDDGGKDPTKTLEDIKTTVENIKKAVKQEEKKEEKTEQNNKKINGMQEGTDINEDGQNKINENNNDNNDANNGGNDRQPPQKTTNTGNAIKTKIRDMGGDKEAALREVMITDYKKNKAAGIYGGALTDDDTMAAMGFNDPDKNPQPILPPQKPQLSKGQRIKKGLATAAGTGFQLGVKGMGYASDAAMLTSAAMNMTLASQEFITQKKDGNAARLQQMNDHKLSRKISAGLAMGSQALNIAQTGIGFVKNVKTAKNSKNKRKKNTAIAGAFSNVAGILTNAQNLVSTGLSGFGDTQHKVAQADTVTTLSVLSSLTSGLSAGMNIFSNYMDLHYRNKSIRDMEKLRKPDDLTNDKLTEAKNNNADKSNYNALKARKYALEQATDFNKIKRTYVKGIAGGAASLVGGANNFMKLVAPTFSKSAVGMLTSSALGAAGFGLGMLQKYGGKLRDKRNDSKAEKKKLEITKNYLAKKRAAVKEQVNTAFAENQNIEGIREVSDNLADRITLGRLGIAVKVTDDELSKELLLRGFEKINMKRANNIMNSGDQKDQILEALGLEKDADISDVAAALTGD